MKDELDGKIMTEFVGLRAKTYSYFVDENFSEATQLQNKISYLERNMINMDSVK